MCVGKQTHKLLLILSVTTLFINCKGEKGDVGPAGEVGQRGAMGSVEISATQPAVYEYTIDLSKSLASWDLPSSFGTYDVALTYIMTNKGNGYNPVLFIGL